MVLLFVIVATSSSDVSFGHSVGREQRVHIGNDDSMNDASI